MSQENVEIVRRLFDAVAGRDTATVLALYDRDLEWTAREVDGPSFSKRESASGGMRGFGDSRALTTRCGRASTMRFRS